MQIVDGTLMVKILGYQPMVKKAPGPTSFLEIWASTQENLSSGVCEQHRRRLISAFVIRFLESIISNLLQAKCQFSS